MPSEGDHGGTTINNRILSTGHDTSLPTDGSVNDALATDDAWQLLRSEANVGASVVIADRRGDCLAPRAAEEAVSEGLKAAREI